MLFLLAAMTYINTLEERRVFQALRAASAPVDRGFMGLAAMGPSKECRLDQRRLTTRTGGTRIRVSRPFGFVG